MRATDKYWDEVVRFRVNDTDAYRMPTVVLRMLYTRGAFNTIVSLSTSFVGARVGMGEGAGDGSDVGCGVEVDGFAVGLSDGCPDGRPAVCDKNMN